MAIIGGIPHFQTNPLASMSNIEQQCKISSPKKSSVLVKASCFNFTFLDHCCCFFNCLLAVLGPCDSRREPRLALQLTEWKAYSMDGGAHQYLLILQSHQSPSKSIHVTQCDTRLRHILLLKHFIGAACSTDSGPESRHPPSGQKVKWAQPSTPALRVLHGAMSESPLRAMLVTC